MPWAYGDGNGGDGWSGGPNGWTGGKWWSWRDALWPYVKNIRLYYCPSVPKYFAYGYNSWLTAVADAQVVNSATTVFICSTAPGNYHIQPAVLNVMAGNGRKYGEIHTGGTNYTFCDGHAKFYKLGSGPTGSRNVNTGATDWWTVDMNFAGWTWWDYAVAGE